MGDRAHSLPSPTVAIRAHAVRASGNWNAVTYIHKVVELRSATGTDLTRAHDSPITVQNTTAEIPMYRHHGRDNAASAVMATAVQSVWRPQIIARKYADRHVSAP